MQSHTRQKDPGNMIQIYWYFQCWRHNFQPCQVSTLNWKSKTIPLPAFSGGAFLMCRNVLSIWLETSFPMQWLPGSSANRKSMAMLRSWLWSIWPPMTLAWRSLPRMDLALRKRFPSNLWVWRKTWMLLSMWNEPWQSNSWRSDIIIWMCAARIARNEKFINFRYFHDNLKSWDTFIKNNIVPIGVEMWQDWPLWKCAAVWTYPASGAAGKPAVRSLQLPLEACQAWHRPRVWQKGLGQVQSKPPSPCEKPTFGRSRLCCWMEIIDDGLRWEVTLPCHISEIPTPDMYITYHYLVYTIRDILCWYSSILCWYSCHHLFPGTGETLKLKDKQLWSPSKRTMLGKRWRPSSHGMNHKHWKHFKTNTLSNASFLEGVQVLPWCFANPKNEMVLSTKWLETNDSNSSWLLCSKSPNIMFSLALTS